MTPREEHEFSEFVALRGTSLLRLARLLVLDAHEAEDLLQAALIRVLRRWPKGLDAPDAYTRTVLVNLARDRSRRRHLVPVAAAATDDLVAPDRDIADAVVARTELDRALAVLPERQRATVVLRIIEGWSEAETAAAMGCAPGTVKSNLSRGLEKVRTAMSPSLTPPEGTRR